MSHVEENSFPKVFVGYTDAVPGSSARKSLIQVTWQGCPLIKPTNVGVKHLDVGHLDEVILWKAFLDILAYNTWLL